ncbi:M48 family metallopeptidase [Parapedobacter soli]|uniref:M48 family metallopeptidase n=1 Tax=Parapedobacter soli TaxID=416955 RepID=UPI0021C68BB8|nr:SprT family zinc-dependent metalloprotease [Parapedobacter soli]
MQTETIKIGGVEIEVRFKDIKNLHLSVHPPLGKVTISSPIGYSLEKLRIYAATKLGWIKKEQHKFHTQEREPIRDYTTQESHFFLGTRYLLRMEKATKNTVEVKGRKILIRSTDPSDKVLSEMLLYRFYRKELRQLLISMIAEKSKAMDVPAPPFRIRRMKTKWGSCAVDKSRVWFNIELAKKPLDCIEYVVVHELVHLLERHHNKRFILLMDKHLPSWRTQKKLLNELPLLHAKD